MSHAHAFPCIRTFNSLYFDILLLVLFWLSVCLSLSLSWVSLLLWHLNANLLHPRNHLCSGAFSSFDPAPFFVWFYDDGAWKDFSENFFRWGIHSECHVVLSNFFDIDLPTVTHSRGWKSLWDILVTCPSVIIQEFYSNMHWIYTSIPHFFSRVRSTRIVVTPEIVSEVLHVPRVTHPDYPGCECLRTMFKDKLSSRFCEIPSS